MTMTADTQRAAKRPAFWRSFGAANLNALIGLVVVAVLFELLGWLVRDQSFLFNTQRLSILILQVSVVGIVAIGVTQVIITGGDPAP